MYFQTIMTFFLLWNTKGEEYLKKTMEVDGDQWLSRNPYKRSQVKL